MQRVAFPRVFVVFALACGCSDGNGSTGSSTSAAPTTSATTSGASSTPLHSTEPAPSVSATAPVPSASATALASGSASATPPKPTSTADAGTPAPSGTAVATATPTATAVATSTPLPPPDPGSADAVAADIDTAYAGHKRYKAKFIQKYHQKVQGTDKESHGSVFVERPNKISFRYEAPNMNRIVSDGSMLKVYVADDSQMYQNPVKDTEYPGALGFIMGEGIRKSFTFTFNDKAKFDKGPVLVGKPRSATPAYQAVQFYIDKDKLAKKDLGAVVAVLILDAQENKNRFEFFDAEEPSTIDASEFSFTPPAGTTIQQ